MLLSPQAHAYKQLIKKNKIKQKTNPSKKSEIVSTLNDSRKKGWVWWNTPMTPELGG